jgi:cardiolipin synthase A/B
LLGIIPHNRKPSSAMAWLLLVFLIPFLGFAVFLVLGRTEIGRRRHEKQAEVNELIRQRTSTVTAPADHAGTSYVDSVVTLNRNLGALPASWGNEVALHSDYRESIEAMTAAVDGAQHFVHVQFYITAWDDVTEPFFAALVRATERGVKVRLLFDHLGSRGIPVYKDLLARLEKTKIEWHPMMPIQPLKGRWRRPDLRNHRKILVVDGRVGFAGSQNLIEPGYDKPKNHELGREWVELTTRVEGPVVAELNAVFLTDWYSETDEILDDTMAGFGRAGEPVGDLTVQVVPSGPGFATENNLRMFTVLLYSAQSRISITSPYFVPDESLLYAVTTAPQRGIDVELFVSEAADQFMVHHAQVSYYEALLKAGVRIYLYPAPYVLHSKHFTIDDDVAVIGSSNMDMRSFVLNYEVSLMLLGPEVVAEMRKVEDSNRAIAKELILEDWLARSRGSAYVDNVMRLTAALQ